MSGTDPARPDLAARLAPLLRAWALLREQETELLRRMAEAIESSSRDEVTAARPAEPAGGAGGPESPPVPEPQASQAPPREAGGPADRAWIDSTIDAVLAGAFSAEEPEDAEELPAVDLLLLRSAGTWVGMPWASVSTLGLSDDLSLPEGSSLLSLAAILGNAMTSASGEPIVEPYRLTWEDARGPHALACEVLGGVIVASAAAERGVDLVWLTDRSEQGGRLVPLVEFFALGGADPERENGEEPGAIESGSSGPEASGTEAGASIAVTPPAVPLPVTPAPMAPPEPAPAPIAPPAQAPTPAPAPASPPAPVSAAPPPPVQAPRLPSAPESAPPPAPAPAPRSTPAFTEAPAAFPAGSSFLAGDAGLADAESLRSPDPGRAGVSRVMHHNSHAALVAVRYLPARVAIARALRTHGWFVLEAADTEDLPDLLQRLHHTAVFCEAPESPGLEWIEALVRARDDGSRIIAVASRLRGAIGDPFRALGAIPRLRYPFQEVELERLIIPPELKVEH